MSKGRAKNGLGHGSRKVEIGTDLSELIDLQCLAQNRLFNEWKSLGGIRPTIRFKVTFQDGVPGIS